MAREEIRPDPVAVSKRRTGRYTSDPISLGLRKLWQNVEQEQVPAEFLDLLDAIDAASADDELPDGAQPDTKPTGETT
jgi:hypothetical protein